MVEDETDILTFLGEFDGKRKLASKNTEVEGEVTRGEMAEVCRKVRGGGEFVWHDVQDAAKSDEFGMRDFVEKGGKTVRFFWAAVGNDAGDVGFGMFGELTDVLKFRWMMRVVWRRFHEDGFLNASGSGGRLVVIKVKGTIRKCWDIVSPRVGPKIRINEVLMGINDGKIHRGNWGKWKIREARNTNFGIGAQKIPTEARWESNAQISAR